MLVACAELKNAEKVRQYLVKHQLLHYDYLPVKVLNEIFFPLSKRASVPSAAVKQTNLKFQKKPATLTLEDLLGKQLSKKQLALLPKSQEIVGDILILELPAELEQKEKVIAQACLKLNPLIKTVVKKTKSHSGTYRTRKVKILAGKRTKETIHRENGVWLKLHLEKAYFSARSANERLRVAKQIKSGEEVLVLFSGVAPYPLVLAKNSPASKVVGIEMNPSAHQYAMQNLQLNNVDNVVIHRGDVRLVLPKLRGGFDRVVMPLPKTSEEFLSVVLPKVRKNGIIHLYVFSHEDKVKQEAQRIKADCQQEGKKVQILKTVKCGSFSPGIFRFCFEIKVLN